MATGLDTWFHNFSQVSYYANTPKNVADVKSPYIEYGIYMTFKAVQVSSFIGGLIVHPIYRFYLHRRLTLEKTTNNSYKVIRNVCRRLQGRCLLAGYASTPLLMAASIWWNGYSTEDLRQRCYEIRCNADGLVYDRSTFALGMIGWYWKRLQGMVDGVNLAILYTFTYFAVLKPYTNPMMIDRLDRPDEKSKRYATVTDRMEEDTELSKFINLRKQKPTPVNDNVESSRRNNDNSSSRDL